MLLEDLCQSLARYYMNRPVRSVDVIVAALGYSRSRLQIRVQALARRDAVADVLLATDQG